jgi:hypothetical protein
VGVSLLVALIGAVLLLVTGIEHYLGLVIFGLTMMIPLSVLFASVKNNAILKGYTLLLAVLGITGIVSAFMSDELANGFAMAYVLGIFLFQLVANFLIIRDGRR